MVRNRRAQLRGATVWRREGERDMIVPLESAEQRRVVVWVNNMAQHLPELELFYAVPNGGSRQRAEAAIMKAEGVRAGVPDTCLPWPNDSYAGLYVEMKRRAFAMCEKNPTQWGTISEDQLKWLTRLTHAGHHAVVCRGAEHAQQTIEAYCRDDVAGLAELNQWWIDLPPAMLERVTKKDTKKKPAARRPRQRVR